MQALRRFGNLSNKQVLRNFHYTTPYSTMRALVYKSTGSISLQERPKPLITSPTDAIIKLTKTTICGTDLHIMKGDVATCKEGTILGHEGVGVVEEAGSGVKGFKGGEKVLISCICSCASCEYCRRGMYSHCTSGGLSSPLLHIYWGYNLAS